MGSKRQSNEFLVQGTILAAAAIVVRFIGLLYRIPMANILGEEGNGIYTVAFNIYNIILILSSYSLPLAVSKLIASRNVKRQYRNVNKIFRCALTLAIIVGAAAGFLLFFGADFLAGLYNMPEAVKPLRVLAPTIFIVAVLGVFRGLYQGKNTMLPTAFSQILEQAVNAAVSIYAAYAFMHAHSLSSEISAYGAAGGTMGTLSGAFVALLFLLFIFTLYRPTLIKQARRDRSRDYLTSQETYRLLLYTITPIILSQTVYQLSGTLDDAIFSNAMAWKGVQKDVKTALLGVYSSQYKILITVPISISSAMASSLIPSIVASMEVKRYDLVREKIRSSVKFNMVIAFPCTIGLMVLADPIIKVLFPSLITYRALAGKLLIAGSAAVIFYALSTTTSGVLQGINLMRLPVRHSFISLILHVPLVLVLLLTTDLGVYALIIGNITFPLVVCMLNWNSIAKELYYHQELLQTFLLPFIASVFMGAGAFGVYHLVRFVLKSEVIGLGSSIAFAVVIYFSLILKLRCFSVEELYDLPLGRTIVKLGRKWNLI